MAKAVPKSFWLRLIHPLSPLQYLGIMVLVGIVFGVVSGESFFSSWERALLVSFWSFSLTFVLATGNAAIVVYLDQKISWIDQTFIRIGVGLVAQVIYSLIGFMAVQLLYQYLFFGMVPDNLVRWIIQNGPMPVIISISISAFFTVRGFLYSWRDSEVRAAKLRTQMEKYRYESLRSQLNPHFLFNSFNVLGDLIYEDQDLAARFLQRLSKLYRYVLESREQEMVPLEKELEFVKAFSYLLEIRFENKLEVHFEVEIQENEWLVPMSLQLLVENAVKHNEVSSLHPLKVEVGRENEWIYVRNVLRKRDVGDDSKGTGLKNLREQYQMYSNRPIQISQENGQFEVRLPILTQQQL